MEAFDSYHNSIDTPRFHRLPQIIKNLFRITEIFLIVVLLITRLPLAVKIIISIVINHNLLIFIIGNVIVLTIFFNSRHNSSSIISTENGHYLGFITSQLESIIPTSQLDNSAMEFTTHDQISDLQQDQVVIFQDKHTVSEVTRSQSPENLPEELRRVADDGGNVQLSPEMMDHHELSNEEFQRAVEDFIAKQIQFHQLEKHALMEFHGTFYGMKSH